MKLKKIASLALAGIMAVSMLTACGEGANDIVNPTPNPDPTPSTSEVVSTIDKAMKDYNSNATINVKESDFLNARIDKLVASVSYQELSKDDDALLVKAIESAFDKDDMEKLTADNLEAENLASKIGKKDKNGTVQSQESWFYAIMDEGTVSSTTALVAAANHLGEQMKDLKDSFLIDSKSHVEIGGNWYRPGKPGTVDTQIACNAGYTMYVYHFNATSTGDTSVPLTVAVLKVNVSQKV